MKLCNHPTLVKNQSLLLTVSEFNRRSVACYAFHPLLPLEMPMPLPEWCTKVFHACASIRSQLPNVLVHSFIACSIFILSLHFREVLRGTLGTDLPVAAIRNVLVLLLRCPCLLKGFEKCAKLFDELDIEGTKARVRSIRPDMSGKMLLLARRVLSLCHFPLHITRASML